VATFLLLGDRCTRSCGFCHIATGKPLPPDPEEPVRVALMAKELGIRHVVLTSVNRDDLPDGGAHHFLKTMDALRNIHPSTVEVLVPDFKGDLSSVAVVCSGDPEVFNHNVETVPSLYRKVRPQGNYERSLKVLEFSRSVLPKRWIKTGIMVGLGEDLKALTNLFYDLSSVGVDILTIGQYFSPTTSHLPVVRYYNDEEFSSLGEIARSAGIPYVFSGRFVRSSYLAENLLHQIGRERNG
jgi:lipoic acid synthetase